MKPLELAKLIGSIIFIAYGISLSYEQYLNQKESALQIKEQRESREERDAAKEFFEKYNLEHKQKK